MPARQLMKRIRTAGIACLVGTAIAFPATAAEPWRIVIPTAAQGSTDILSRELGQHLARVLGAPVETENLPGKSGTIAARYRAALVEASTRDLDLARKGAIESCR
jgi:tripartite-type tricarboxylate transporter receptor subunit TctC